MLPGLIPIIGRKPAAAGYAFTMTAGLGGGGQLGYDDGTWEAVHGSIGSQPIPDCTINTLQHNAFTVTLWITGSTAYAKLTGLQLYVNGVGYGRADGGGDWTNFGSGLSTQWSGTRPSFSNGVTYDCEFKA